MAAASSDAVPSKSTPASRFLVIEVFDQLIDDTEVTAPLSADWYLAVYRAATQRAHNRKCIWLYTMHSEENVVEVRFDPHK